MVVGIFGLWIAIIIIFLLSAYITLNFNKNDVKTINNESDFVSKISREEIFIFSATIVGMIAFFITMLFAISLLAKTGGDALKLLIIFLCINLISALIYNIYKSDSFFTAMTRIVIACAITLIWVIWPNWLTLNVAAILITISILIGFKNFKFRYALLISLAIMIYDVISVFGTHMMQNTAKAIIGNLPLLLIVPQTLTLNSEPMFALGLGDIIVPGIIIMIAARESERLKNNSIILTAIFGYTFGFALAFTVLLITNFPQPATIYLIPTTIAAFWWKIKSLHKPIS